MKEMTSLLITAAAAAMAAGFLLLPVTLPSAAFAEPGAVQEAATGDGLPDPGIVCLCALKENTAD